MATQTKTNPPESKRVQLNARVSKASKLDIKMDAAQAEQPIDLITDSIIQRFYHDYPDAEERKAIYVARKQASGALFG